MNNKSATPKKLHPTKPAYVILSRFKNNSALVKSRKPGLFTKSMLQKEVNAEKTGNNRYSKDQRNEILINKSAEFFNVDPIKTEQRISSDVSGTKTHQKNSSPYLKKARDGSVDRGNTSINKIRNYSLSKNSRNSQIIKQRLTVKQKMESHRRIIKSQPKERFKTQQKQRQRIDGTDMLRTQYNSNKKKDINQRISSIIKTKIQEKKTKVTTGHIHEPCRDSVCIHKLNQILESYKDDPNEFLIKIFKHYANIYLIYQNMKLKANKKNSRWYLPRIIDAIREYVLEEVGDSAELESIYQNGVEKEEITHHPQIRKILFLQKLAIIMVIEVIISSKYNLVQSYLLKVFECLLEFYAATFSDLSLVVENNNLSNKLDLSILAAYLTRQQLTLLQQVSKKPLSSFSYYQKKLLSCKNHCYKFVRNIEQFHQLHYQSCEQFPINYLYYKLLEFYSLQLLGSDWSDFNIEFLETCPSPYLHFPTKKKLTLVLDLDETLIHFKVNNTTDNTRNKNGGKFLIRPYLHQFLKTLSQYYQIGIFTCGLPDYADIILDRLDHIQFRLYRHHAIRLNGQYAKDLSRIGRDLKSTLLVDNIPRNFRLQRQNGISIKSWYGDKSDKILMKMANQLSKIGQSICSSEQEIDIREFQLQRQFLQ